MVVNDGIHLQQKASSQFHDAGGILAQQGIICRENSQKIVLSFCYLL